MKKPVLQLGEKEILRYNSQLFEKVVNAASKCKEFWNLNPDAFKKLAQIKEKGIVKTVSNIFNLCVR